MADEIVLKRKTKEMSKSEQKKMNLFAEHYARYHHLNNAAKYAGYKISSASTVINHPLMEQMISRYEAQYRRQSQSTVEQLVDFAKKIMYNDNQITKYRLHAADFIAKISGFMQRDERVSTSSINLIIKRSQDL